MLSAFQVGHSDVPAARAALDAAIAKQPQNPFLYQQLAAFEVQQRNPHGAIAAIRGFFALDHTVDKTHDIVVGLLVKADKLLAGLGQPQVPIG